MVRERDAEVSSEVAANFKQVVLQSNHCHVQFALINNTESCYPSNSLLRFLSSDISCLAI